MEHIERIEDLRAKVLIRKGTWRKIAREAGLNYFTLIRFAHGTHEPMYTTVQKISGYFAREEEVEKEAA